MLPDATLDRRGTPGSQPAGLELVSFELCPYVQRVAIVLAEKGLTFTRRWIDLSAKPDWFLAISPLSKVPVLLVDGSAIFESSVICAYLDDIAEPQLTAIDPLTRATERAWAEHASATLSAIGALYNAPDHEALQTRRDDLRHRFSWVEQALHDQGPWFCGERFGLVDAAYAPVFRYLTAFDAFSDFGLLQHTPRVAAWRQRLAERPSVRGAVVEDFDAKLLRFMQRRPSALGDLARAGLGAATAQRC